MKMNFTIKVSLQKLLGSKNTSRKSLVTVDYDEEEEVKKDGWGGRKNSYYNANNANFEIRSSDDESLADEEAEVLRLQKENVQSMSKSDFGIGDSSEDESDRELTLQEKSVKGKGTRKSVSKKDVADEMDVVEINKNLSSLSREELNDFLNRSAPELVGLLSELDDATQELESKVDPLLKKVENGEIKLEAGVRYIELKKQLLLTYCQAIVFYLLLKSEGQPVRDHPALARIVEIKSLLDKTKELDENCSMELGEILHKSNVVNLGKENVTSVPVAPIKEQEPARVSKETKAEVVANKNAELTVLKENAKKAEKRKRQDDQVGAESMKMLKTRAALEEKLKQTLVVGSTAKVEKSQKLGKLLNRRLETYDDFNDDTANASSRGLVNGLSSSRVAKLIVAKLNKPKIISGDDDIPTRDDIGERRRKHELRVLSRAGVARDDEEADMNEVDDDHDVVDDDHDVDDEEDSGSEDDFYKQVKQQRAAKLAAKAEIYSRTAAVPSLPETTDGKRLINYQMEKNRGLTRQRKKLTKNPRKKYKLKHEKAVKARSGQVRQVKKPMGQYGGESSGINSRISRSVRFNN